MTTSTDTASLERAAAQHRRFTWPAWGWSGLGVIIVWICILTVSTGSIFQPLTQALTLVPYLVLAAAGQMLVITLGPGNIDVSIGTVISMAAYVSVAVGAQAGVTVGVLAAVASGLAAALISVIAILLLRVPPIIATLATSLVVASVVLILADSNQGGSIDALRRFVNFRVLGIPSVAFLVLLVTIIVALVLRRTTFGRGVIAIGQSEKAAAKAGIRVKVVTGLTYLLCGGFAGLAGGILAALIAPSTVLGTSYMLDSIAVVVIGGTLIAGGRPVVTGLWTGAFFFVMLSSLLNLIGWSVGQQNVLKGLLVVLVVVISSRGTGASTLHRFTSRFTGGLFNRSTASLTGNLTQKAGTHHG